VFSLIQLVSTKSFLSQATGSTSPRSAHYEPLCNGLCPFKLMYEVLIALDSIESPVTSSSSTSAALLREVSKGSRSQSSSSKMELSFTIYSASRDKKCESRVAFSDA